MVCRRFVALGALVIVLSVLGFVSSCSSPDCANGADGCPCTTDEECALPNSCYSVYCDGTCHVNAVLPERPCPVLPCANPEHCWGVCTAEPQCVECLDDAHCGAGHTCEVGNVCSRCDDGVKNGDEIGVDCGGSCPLCSGTCNVDLDCPGGYCWKGMCASCHDGIQNGDEMGVDCSEYGGRCGHCAGVDCGVNAHCASSVCEGGVCCSTPCPLCYECKVGVGECVPIKYGWEDFYNAVDPTNLCGGSYVCDGNGKCGLYSGHPCSQNDDCASAMCVNGTCK